MVSTSPLRSATAGFVVALITTLAASSVAGSDAVDEAWKSYRAAETYEAAAEISRSLLTEEPENKYYRPMIRSVVDEDFYRRDRRDEAVGFVEGLLDRLTSGGNIRFTRLLLLELYAEQERLFEYDNTFDLIASADDLGEEDYYQLMRLSAVYERWITLNRAILAAEPYFIGEKGRGYLATFRAWYMANHGELEDGLRLFAGASELLATRSYGYSLFPLSYLFWGQALLLDGRVDEGVEKIARCAFWTGDRVAMERLEDALRVTSEGDIDVEKQIAALRAQHAPVVPDFVAYDYSGDAHTLASVTGKVTVLLYWSVTCGPCHREMLHMKDTFERYRADGLAVVAYSLQPSDLQDQLFISSNGLEYTFLRTPAGTSPRAAAENQGVKFFPTTLVLDSDRRALYRHVNYRPGDWTTIEKEIVSMLKKQGGGNP